MSVFQIKQKAKIEIFILESICDSMCIFCNQWAICKPLILNLVGLAIDGQTNKVHLT